MLPSLEQTTLNNLCNPAVPYPHTILPLYDVQLLMHSYLIAHAGGNLPSISQCSILQYEPALEPIPSHFYCLKAHTETDIAYLILQVNNTLDGFVSYDNQSNNQLPVPAVNNSFSFIILTTCFIAWYGLWTLQKLKILKRHRAKTAPYT